MGRLRASELARRIGRMGLQTTVLYEDHGDAVEEQDSSEQRWSADAAAGHPDF